MNLKFLVGDASVLQLILVDDYYHLALYQFNLRA